MAIITYNSLKNSNIFPESSFDPKNLKQISFLLKNTRSWFFFRFFGVKSRADFFSPKNLAEEMINYVLLNSQFEMRIQAGATFAFLIYSHFGIYRNHIRLRSPSRIWTHLQLVLPNSFYTSPTFFLA